MHGFILAAISWLLIFQGAVFSEECIQGVLGKRETYVAPEGSTLTLSCVVRHCGCNWTGSWNWENVTASTRATVKDSGRHRLTHVPLSANKTKQDLTFVSVAMSDEGSYGCNVKWSDGSNEVSHRMQVNVTEGVAFQRKLSHRILVCAGAFLCLPVILVLARCLSSEVKPQQRPRTEVLYAAVSSDRSNLPPQPPPRRPVPKKRTTLSHKAPSTSQLKPELLYADISQDALRRHEAVRAPAQPTVYSSLRFS